MKRTLPLFAALALAACATLPAAATGPTARPSARSPRVDALSSCARVEVVEDSRCPINARCVWAGRLVLRAEVSKRGWRETRNLTLGERRTSPAGNSTLASAEPGKLAGEQPPPPPTRFTFDFEGRPQAIERRVNLVDRAAERAVEFLVAHLVAKVGRAARG